MIEKSIPAETHRECPSAAESGHRRRREKVRSGAKGRPRLPRQGKSENQSGTAGMPPLDEVSGAAFLIDN